MSYQEEDRRYALLDNLVRLLGISWRTAFRKIAKEEWKARECGVGRNGKPRREVLVESLPLEYQNQWRQLQAESEASEEREAHEVQIAESYDERTEKLQAALLRFSPPDFKPEHRQAIENRCVQMGRLCDEALRVMEDLKARRKMVWREAGGAIRFNQDLVALAAKTSSSDPVFVQMYPGSAVPLSVKSFVGIVRRYRKEGPAVFVHRGQNIRPDVDSRFVTVPPKAIDWLKRNLKNYSKASIAKLGEDWLTASKRLGFDLPFTTHRPGQADSCYMWLYRWTKRIPGPAATFISEGDRGIEAKYGYVLRDYSDLKPRDGFVMDWRPHDVECWLPARKAGGRPLLFRLSLCPVLDLASSAVFGFDLTDRPNARGVTRAYLNAIADGRWAEWKAEPGLQNLCGMQATRDERRPAFVYWDNGKDYRSYAVEGKEIIIRHFDLESGLVALLMTYRVGLAAEINIMVRHARKFNPKAKPVEPWFNYAVAAWEKSLPGYKGRSPSDRPSWYPAARRVHESFVRRQKPRPSDVRLLPASWREVFDRHEATYGFGTPFLSEIEFRAEFDKFLFEYLHRPHGRLANDLGDVSPIEFVNRYADTPHMLTGLSIAALLMESRVVGVRRGELAVAWRGERFIYREVESDLSDGHGLLRLPERSEVEFRWDPNCLGRALVISGGAPLCWVEEPQLLSWNATSEAFEAAYLEKKKARKVAREFLETRTQVGDWREQLSEGATLPAEASKILPFKPSGAIEQSESGGESCRQSQLPTAIVIQTRYDGRHASFPESSTSQITHRTTEENDSSWADPWEVLGLPDQVEDEDWKEAWETR